MYVAQDANYNTTALFDTSGNIVERYAYDPYGRATILAPDWSERAASLFAWQHLHQGFRFDPLTGLYHNRARDYSPGLMRFASVDPVWATNLYAAYGNGPTDRLDPSGQGWLEIVAGAVTAVAVTAVVATAVVAAGPVLLAAAATTAAVIGVSTTTVTTVATVTAVAVGAAATGKAGYEAATGKEAFTGRRLSDFERGFAFGSLVTGVGGMGAGAARGLPLPRPAAVLAGAGGPNVAATAIPAAAALPAERAVAAVGVANILMMSAPNEGQGVGSSGEPCPAGEAPTARRAPARDNYRGRYMAERHAQGRPRLPDDWDVHHRIPQEYMNHPEFRDFDFHHPSNLQGVRGSRADVNVHQRITNEWAEFRRQNPNATRAQIENFARQIDQRYANEWFQ